MQGTPSTSRGPSFHFVEIIVAAVCLLAVVGSLVERVFGTAAIIGVVGLVLLGRSLLSNRSKLGP